LALFCSKFLHLEFGSISFSLKCFIGLCCCLLHFIDLRLVFLLQLLSGSI
jgi:hypothetical protein